MQRHVWKLWGAAGLSAALLELPFPLAGPMSAWRSIFAWFGLAPLLWAVLSPATADGPRPLRRAFLLSYCCGFLWYTGNCYWVRDTMSRYRDMPVLAPALLLIGFSLVLGLYFGVFGLGVAMIRNKTGSTRLALAAAPFLWAALELAVLPYPYVVSACDRVQRFLECYVGGTSVQQHRRHGSCWVALLGGHRVIHTNRGPPRERFRFTPSRGGECARQFVA